MADTLVQTFSSEGDRSDEALLGYKRTLQLSDPGTQTQNKDGQGNAEHNSTGAGSNPSDVGVTRDEYETLVKRFNDAQKHIGTLEGENKAMRSIVERFPNRGSEPEPNQQKITDPLDDPAFIEKYKSTFGEDEIAAEANLTMIKQVRDSLRNHYEGQIRNLETGYKQQQYYDQVKAAMWQGMQDAISTYGQAAEELVNEFITSNGTYGALSQAIQKNKAVVESADLVSALIGRLVWQSGGQPQPQPSQQTQTQRQPNPASRPTRSPINNQNEDEVPIEKQIAAGIVAAKSPTQALPFMR